MWENRRELWPPADGSIEHPGDVCGSQHQNAVIIVSHTYKIRVLQSTTYQHYMPACLCSVCMSEIILLFYPFITLCCLLMQLFLLICSLPCIWTKNSVLMRRAASLSFSFLEPHSESTSSMKMMEGLCWRAKSNKFFTNLRDTRKDREKTLLD